jgi:Fusaric acid resistance protein-like
VSDLARVDRSTFDWPTAARSALLLAIPVGVAVGTGFVEAGVFAALGCFNVLLLQFVGTADDRLRRSAWGLVFNAVAVGLGTLVGMLGLLAVPLIVAGLLVAHLVDRVPNAGPLTFCVAVMFVLGVGFPGDSVTQAEVRVPLALLGGALAFAGLALHIAFARRWGRSSASGESPTPSVGTRAAADSPGSARQAWEHSAVMAAVTALAFAVALLAGFARDYWAMLTVIVVLRPRFGQTLSVGVGRMVGTVLGAAIAAVLTTQLPYPPIQGILIVASVLLAFVLIAGNFTQYSVALTVFVILLVNLAFPGGLVLAETRVVDTVLGGGLAIAAGAILWEVQSRRYRPDRSTPGA